MISLTSPFTHSGSGFACYQDRNVRPLIARIPSSPPSLHLRPLQVTVTLINFLTGFHWVTRKESLRADVDPGDIKVKGGGNTFQSK